jgi:glycosyltransferase involved in cell wall biosynthesis
MKDLVWRAAGYYWRNGLGRSLRLLRKKASGKVAWNIRLPAAKSPRYFKDHGAAVKAGPAPGRGLFGAASIVIIGDLNLAQCRKYRVVQKVEALAALGIAAQFCGPQDVARAVSLMQTASHVMFYRLADGPLFRGHLAEARRLGLMVSYDIDDPIFDAEVYGGSRNLDFLAAGERRHLVAQCGGYLAAIKACDRVIVSTPALQELIAARTGQACSVWRNGIDAETRLAASLALESSGRRDDGVVRVGYASGSRAHAADFTEVEAALADLLRSEPKVMLAIAGHHTLSPALAAFGARVEVQPYMNYTAYLSRMAANDINVVPLLQDRCNACKSAIRFLDAAVVAVPTIASRTGDFVNVMEHGRTGMLADGREGWLPVLRELAANADRRRAMGQAARDYAAREMAVARIATGLDGALLAEFGP